MDPIDFGNQRSMANVGCMGMLLPLLNGGTLPGVTNRFSNDLSDLDFSLSVIKLCTRKPLARPREALASASSSGICQPLLYITLFNTVTF